VSVYGERSRRWRRAAVISAHTAGQLGRTTASWLAGCARRRPDTVDVWRRALPDLLVRLGPSFIKFGQLLSTRRDLLSEATCRALSGLTDDVPPPPRESVERVLRAAYGQRLPFAEFDWRPLACGTIASVHRGTLPDGREVAVKVRRAGIAGTMRTDFALATALASTAGRLPALRRIPLAEIVGQVSGAIEGQLDFVAERASLAALADGFAAEVAVRVPRPIDGWCTDDTVVMEYVPDLVAYRPEGLDEQARRAVVTQTLNTVYRMLFQHGLVHCDLHPGNLYLTPGAGVVIVDAGFVVRLPERVRRLFAAFFLNMALGRGGRCADIVIESAAAVDRRCDLTGFRASLAALIDEVTGRSADDFNLAWFAARLFALQRRHGLYAAPEFVFPLLCLLVVEGMVNEFDSGVDFQALALPVLLDGLYVPQTAA
jgi:ubiquinone biosynthesis protein